MMFIKKRIEQFKSLPKYRQQAIYVKYLLVFGIFFTLIAAMAAIKVTPMATYRNKEYKFKIRYPKYWDVYTPKGPMVAFVSPLVDDVDWFQESVNVTTIYVGQRKPSVEEFATVAVRQLVGVYEDNIELMQSRPYKIGPYPGHLVIFAGRKTDTPFKYMIGIFIKNDTAFMVTYAALEEDFDDYLNAVRAMFRSVRVS